MAFHTADYDAYVLLGDPEAPPLWRWEVWQRLSPAMDPLMKATRGKPAVRSTQFLRNPKTAVKFGRLGWKDSDHQKWTHGSPTNEEASESWSFLSTEIWAPAWTVCERENLAPDVFLSVADNGSYRQDMLFNPDVIFAVVSAFAQRHPSMVSAVVSALHNLTRAKLVGYQRRPWGKSIGSIGFTNSIQDLAWSGLFKPGPRHSGDVGLHLFADHWEAVSTQT